MVELCAGVEIDKICCGKVWWRVQKGNAKTFCCCASVVSLQGSDGFFEGGCP
jgi:hypothetical protein